MKWRSTNVATVVFFCIVLVGFLYLWKHKLGRIKLVPQRQNSILILNTPKAEVPKMDKFGCWNRQQVIEEARKIHNRNLTVMITIVNDAFIDFTYSWLCNTNSMGLQSQLLILTTDKHTENLLKKDWPQVNSICLSDISSNGEQIYSNAGYVRLMAQRTELIQNLLNENITVFLFEVDCVWLRNPLIEFKKFSNYDLLAVKVTSNTMRISVSGGFLVLYPKIRTKQLWNQLTMKMKELTKRIERYPETKAISRLKNDQVYLSELLSKKNVDINAKYLSYNEYPDGRWYSLSEIKRKLSNPVVINNNWVEGTKAKMDRAKKWGHWFIKESRKCDVEKLSVLNR